MKTLQKKKKKKEAARGTTNYGYNNDTKKRGMESIASEFFNRGSHR
jgi:hypothetical protein